MRVEVNKANDFKLYEFLTLKEKSTTIYIFKDIFICSKKKLISTFIIYQLKMKKIGLLVILISSVIFCKAQLPMPQTTVKDTISINGNMWKGIKYSYQESKNVEIRRIRKMLNIDSENALLIKQAQNAKLISRVAAVAGGIFLGFSVTSFIADGKVNVPIVATGGALVAVSLPISHISIKKMRQAVLRYNLKQ